MSISKQHSCIRLNHYICILATCLALTSCLSTVKGEKHKHFWYGSTPFEKRQTIEAYKRDTVPMIEKFLAYISQAGAGELIFRGGEQGGPCGENNDGYDYWSPNIFGKPIDVNEVIKAGDEFLVPAGFSKRTKRQYENGDVTLFWLNKKDGGYVTAIVSRKATRGSTIFQGVVQATEARHPPPAQPLQESYPMPLLPQTPPRPRLQPLSRPQTKGNRCKLYASSMSYGSKRPCGTRSNEQRVFGLDFSGDFVESGAASE